MEAGSTGPCKHSATLVFRALTASAQTTGPVVLDGLRGLRIQVHRPDVAPTLRASA